MSETVCFTCRRSCSSVDECLSFRVEAIEQRVDWDEYAPVQTQVRHFRRAMGFALPDSPQLIEEKKERLAVELVAEEALELVAACYRATWFVAALWWVLRLFIRRAAVDVDLVAAADACADVDYVVEGWRLGHGIDGRPIARAVQIANMAKAGGPIHPVTGKRLKPPGWTPPDIEQELRIQVMRAELERRRGSLAETAARFLDSLSDREREVLAERFKSKAS